MYQELLEDPGSGDDYKPTTISNQRQSRGDEKAITRIHLSYPGWVGQDRPKATGREGAPTGHSPAEKGPARWMWG